MKRRHASPLTHGISSGNAPSVSSQFAPIMSHNYRYRGSTSDTNLRPETGHYNSANHRHISPELDFNRPHQESFPSSYSTSSSSRGSTLPQDGALSILNSCGLEPSDLALLAELPEDVLTVDALPHVLKQIKGKKGSICSFPPSTLSSSSSYSSTSYHQAPGSSSRFWDQPSDQTIQYPLEYVGHGSLPSEQDRWRDSRTSNTVRSDFASASLSSSRYTNDFQQRPGPCEYGKTADEFSTQECSSFYSAGQGRSRATGISKPRSLPDVYQTKPRVGHHKSQVSSTGSSSRQAAATSIPSEKEALDFHGTCPTVFPYSCSLCDITVLSEKVWIKHINNTQHAEGQLSILQQFPNWDCRVESVSRAKNQSEKRKDEGKPTQSSQTATQYNKSKTEKKSKKQSSEYGKVVFVKFPPQSVDEVYLRKLAEPFGKIVKILMFPSFAFLELYSIEQAKEFVKFHVNDPPIVNDEQIEFSISDTFNFLQSSKVVSFTPSPTGEDGQSDLISIVKRFGPPLYSLLLPTMAFVEMENAPDAQKLVDYYSSNTLRINNTRIKVSFSGEYKTLMRVPSAKKHAEEKISSKRPRSLSQETGQKTESKRRKDQEHEQEQSSTDMRPSKSSKERRTRSKSRDKQTSSLSASRDKSKEKASGGTRTRSRSKEKSDSKRKNRSRSRDKSKEKVSGGTRTRSKSKEKSASKRKTRSRSRDKSKEKVSGESKTKSTEKTSKNSSENMVGAEKTDNKVAPTAYIDAAYTQQTEEDTVLSAEDSDIEGMEVIGEDGKNVAEEDMEPEKDIAVNFGDEKEDEVVSKSKKPEESETIREKEECAERQLENDEEESDFPVDLENCITLDEVEEDNSDNQGDKFEDEAEGVIKMSSSSEAKRAAQELTHKPVTLNGSKHFVDISHKGQSLSSGWETRQDSDHEESTREIQSKSKTPDTKESLENCPDEKSSSNKAGQTKSDRKPLERNQSTFKEESDAKKDPNKERGSTKKDISKNVSEKSHRGKPDKKSNRNTAEEKLVSEMTEEKLAASIPKDSVSMNQEEDKIKLSPENNLKMVSNGKTQGLNEESRKEKISEGQRVSCKEKRLEAAETCQGELDATGDSLKPHTEQTPENDQLQDFNTIEMEQEPGPAGGTVEPEEPSKPIGTEFVRPVVGYFCNLCQLIYADEDEAKLQHCSSLMHYKNYQEKTGKDPWMS